MKKYDFYDAFGGCYEDLHNTSEEAAKEKIISEFVKKLNEEWPKISAENGLMLVIYFKHDEEETKILRYDVMESDEEDA